MIGWLLYALICIQWGIFAARMHKKIGYPTTRIRNQIIVGLMNAIVCPIALIIAIIRCPIEKK